MDKNFALATLLGAASISGLSKLSLRKMEFISVSHY
jgi:hypothetical protein